MEELINFVFGATGGGAIVWLFRNWISERLKQSISFEYSEKLADHKNELSKKIIEIQHDNQINQLRTSLFFDHQREAFTEILTKIYELKEDWFEDYDPGYGLDKHISPSLYNELQSLIAKHQIFLDDEALFVIDLLLSAYAKSFSYNDGMSEEYEGDISGAYREVSFLTPNLQSLLRQKIGVSDENQSLVECSLFCSMKILNGYNFPKIGLPVEGVLNINSFNQQPVDWVRMAKDNIPELTKKLEELSEYLSQDGFFHEVNTQVRFCIGVIGEK
ncbi:hypothetical protein FKQ62_08390 [Vibrio sp. B1-2]|uniref:hypothetical protein n=1 Tax=Vibrio sp. B1-2 TaxID=2591465 RepID=UPI001482E029|nr:hypothetical protein [Vibrio sp. B1-2]NNN99486.1 hypothetical protein [Vibrio sp. B1-2]